MRWKRSLLVGVPVVLVVAFLLFRGEPAPPPPESPLAEAARSTVPAPPIEDGEGRAPEKPCEIRGAVKTHSADRPVIVGAAVRAWRLDGQRPPGGPAVAQCRSGEDGTYRLSVPGPGRYLLVAQAPGHALVAAPSVRAPGRYFFSLRPATRVVVLVQDREGNPLPGAVVLRQPDAGVHTEEIPCDHNGRAEIDWNTFDHIGARFGELGAPMGRRSPPKGGGPILIRLFRTWCVAGTVVTEEGEPVIGASLHLEHHGPGAKQVRSGAGGAFRFEGVLTYRGGDLRVWADGFASHRRGVVPGDCEVRIVLRPPVVLRGRVIDHDGRPVAAAYVTMVSSAELIDAHADEEGRFAFEGLEPGVIIHGIKADHPDRPQSVDCSGPVALGAPLELRFPPIEESWLVLRVVDPEGNPLHGISCWAPEPGRTDEDGLAVIRSSRPAGSEVEVRFNFFGGGTWKRTIRTAATGDGPPDLVEAPGEKEVTFLVVDPDGHEVPGARVALLVAAGSSAPPRQGPLCMNLQECRGYTARFSAPGYASVVRGFLVPENADTIRVVLRPGARIRGQTNPEYAISVNGGLPQQNVESDGAFDLEVPAGEVTLTAWGRGQVVRAHASVHLRPGETRDLGRLPAVEPCELTGVVVDGTGEPLGGVTVLLRSSVSDSTIWEEVNTHADGTFSCHAAAVGEWVLIAAKEGRIADVQVMRGGGVPSRLQLTCPRGEPVLTVRVRTDGNPGRNEYHLRFAGSTVPFPWPFRDHRAEGDDLVLSYRGLPAGEVTFVLTHQPASGGEPCVIERTVSLEAGATTEIEIRVP